MKAREMSSEYELRSAQARRLAIDAHIAELAAERARLDQRIAEISPTVGDAALPCWQCTQPEAVDARFWLGSNQDSRSSRAASGVPLCRCRIAKAQVGSTIVSYA
jgi:hypothetical protein